MNEEFAPVCLRAEHAVELGELLGFLASLFDGAPDVVGDVLASVCGTGYTVKDLRDDLARFAFLLGAGDEFVVGEHG